MLQIVDRCTKCHNSCKMQSQTQARLIDCRNYISKRSKSNTGDLRHEKIKSHTSYRLQDKSLLNRNSHTDFNQNSQLSMTDL